MVVHIDQVPEPEGQKPTSANVYSVSLANHRYLIPAQELEIGHDMSTADYMPDVAVKSCFEMTGTIKTEMTMRVILWNMVKEGKKKLHTISKPAAQELQTVSFQLASCYEWDTRSMRLRRGDDPVIRASMLRMRFSCTMPEAQILQSWKIPTCIRRTRETVLQTAMQRLTMASSTSGQVSKSWLMMHCSWRILG